MKLSIERNHDPETRETQPYYIALEIVRATADIGRVYKIPVYIRYFSVYKHYHVEICGVRIDAQNKPYSLLEPVKELCQRLVNVSRLPSYVFIARRAKHVYPAYTIGDEVFITTIGGGPVFRHIELAKVRARLTDYLHDIKVLGTQGKSDKLHVRGVDPNTLGLRRPVMYLKKRVVGEEDFWAPVFESGDGHALYAIAVSHRRETPITDGREILNLRDIVAHSLQVDKRLTDLYDLRADRIIMPYWKKLESHLVLHDEMYISGHTYPIYKSATGREWYGGEMRPDEDRLGLYLGNSPEDVVARMTRDFARRHVQYDP